MWPSSSWNHGDRHGSDYMNGNNPDNILMWWLILFWSCSLQHLAVYLLVSFLISISLRIHSDCLIPMQAPHLSCHCYILEKMQEECFVSPVSRCDRSRWMDKIWIYLMCMHAIRCLEGGLVRYCGNTIKKKQKKKTMFRHMGNLNGAFYVPRIGAGLNFYATFLMSCLYPFIYKTF